MNATTILLVILTLFAQTATVAGTVLAVNGHPVLGPIIGAFGVACGNLVTMLAQKSMPPGTAPSADTSSKGIP